MEEYSINANTINIEGTILTKFFLEKMKNLFEKNSVNQGETVELIRGQVGVISEQLAEIFLGTPMAKIKYIDSLIDGLLNVRARYQKELENFIIPNYTKQ